ncbi:hypothetical protein NMY22_g14568 [Coprinellus aureogranulatus]|nr:hypothetical protein NMY22_g14568 [Coprinellus aureogranulatus]
MQFTAGLLDPHLVPSSFSVTLPKRQAHTSGGDEGPAKLASRLSDARTVTENQAHHGRQQPRQPPVTNQQSRSNPSSRYNSPAIEASPSAPSLLQRFGDSSVSQTPRSAGPNSRGRGGHRGGHGRGRGGGSGGGGGQSHQSLNNRISSSGSQPVSLLQRIRQD